MNSALRKVVLACLLMFGALMVNANILQVGEASSLKNKPENGRQLAERLSRERGPIVVGTVSVAKSMPINDQYKYQRAYPAGPLYAPVTGYYTLYTATGIEKSQDDLLSGEDDRLFVRRLSDYLTGREPQGGAVVLTLDAKAQYVAAQALGNKKGAVVAIDPRTGAILAMYSSPSFDPNPLASHDAKKASAAYTKLADDPNDPLLNRAAQQTYPPGSLFKIVTSAAALSSGKYTPTSVIPAPHQLKLPDSTSVLNNFGGETCGNGTTDTLIDALTISCNTAFGQLGLNLGADALGNQARAFGIGSTIPDLGIPQATSVFPSDLDRPQTALSAIGQYNVRITPLQAAMIVAAVADKGTLMRPYIIDQLRAPNLSVLDRTTPHELGQAIAPDVAAELTLMMQSVVDHGTGTAAQIPGFSVAGKTGTAQHATGAAPHAWFAGFAPVGSPKVAVAVVVEDGGNSGNEATGGTVAAPIAKAVMQTLLAERS
jgi:peptidoglycan glycosyltransferase